VAKQDRNVVLIVNPIAGGGRGRKALDQALPVFRELGVDPVVCVTASGSEVTGVTRQAVADGADLIVAVGGDGHLAAVGEGLVGTDSPLGILPAGSANDYARIIGMPHHNLRAAVEAILSGQPRTVDALSVTNASTNRIFLNVLGTGFDAVVAHTAGRIPFLRSGGRYILAIVRELPRYRATSLEFTVDGSRHTINAMMIAIANGHSYGGGMRIAPNAALDDGKLDICIVGEVSKLQFMRAFPRVFKGTHVTHPAVTMMRGVDIEIDADQQLPLVGDGELVRGLPARVRVVPNALSVVFPSPPDR
jgi:diacylglycerol kinase (ATP)